MRKNLPNFAFFVGAGVVAVLTAGLIMSKMRGDVDFIAQAHAGYDS